MDASATDAFSAAGASREENDANRATALHFPWPSGIYGLAAAAAFFALYFILDQLDHIGPTRDWPVAPWNPELGLCLAAAIRWRARALVMIFLAPIFDDLVLSGPVFALDDGLWTGVITIAEVMGIVAGADALRLRSQNIFRDDLAALLLITLPCAAIAAVAGASRLTAFEHLPDAEFSINVGRLWVGDVIGVFIVAPLFHIKLLPDPGRRPAVKNLAEMVVQAMAALVSLWLAFGQHPRIASRYFYVVFPPMIWVVLRHGARGAIVLNAFVQTGMIIALSGREDVDVSLFQALLLVFAATSLTLGLMVDQTKAATAQLHAREEELAASLKIAATGELAGTLAHELGHPLGAISNYAAALNHVIREIAPPDSSAPKIGAKLTHEIVRATDTLHRLREFFRTGSLSMEPLDLGVLMKDAIRLLRDRLDNNAVMPHMAIPPGPVMVLADKIQLRAVIYNLVVNAVDALKPVPMDRRVLAVTVRRNGNMAELEVEDSGSGIAADVKDHIFEPLVTTKKDGLGLGLSMSRSVVAAHGGSIALMDSRLGGAKFVVSLPLEDA